MFWASETTFASPQAGEANVQTLISHQTNFITFKMCK